MEDRLDIQIGGAGLIDIFLTDIEAVPWTYERMVLVSPYIKLNSNSSVGNRIRDAILTISRLGGTAKLISELSEARLREFNKAVSVNRELSEDLELCSNLHAKCGYSIPWKGGCSAFMGSANLSCSSFEKNIEAVLLIRNSVPRKADWLLFSAIKQYTDELLDHSILYSEITSIKGGARCFQQ